MTSSDFGFSKMIIAHPPTCHCHGLGDRIYHRLHCRAIVEIGEVWAAVAMAKERVGQATIGFNADWLALQAF